MCVSVLLLLFSHSVVSASLRLHGLQYARLPCPSPSPGVCSNSCLLSRWCHPTISSSNQLLDFFFFFFAFPSEPTYQCRRLKRCLFIPWRRACQKDHLEKGMATHSSILAWRITWTEGAWQAPVHGVAKSLTWLKQLSMHAHTHHLQVVYKSFTITMKIINF